MLTFSFLDRLPRKSHIRHHRRLLRLGPKKHIRRPLPRDRRFQIHVCAADDMGCYACACADFARVLAAAVRV